jgi:CRISPR-associated endonuclease Csn1
MRAEYRIGIDLGTNSLGWCVFDLDRDKRPRGIRRIGVRIFSDGRDPQSGTSLAFDRRLARGQRRRRDRYLDRRKDLIRVLIRHGLMPGDEPARKKLETLDPYEIRARGLDQALSLHEFGRALFHLDQRRGFKSNRKTDRPADPEKLKEAANMKGAALKLEQAIADRGFRTLGEYLYKTARKGGAFAAARTAAFKHIYPCGRGLTPSRGATRTIFIRRARCMNRSSMRYGLRRRGIIPN